jgi:hypothetical protein
MSTPGPMGWLVLGMFAALSASAQPAPAQQERTRQIWDANLLTKRPAGKNAAAKPPGQPDDALVGITLWRFRPSKASDEAGVRALVQEAAETREYTPERISADTPLHEQQRVRISIESARTGYIYVIDREEYANGSKGDPYLIFPTLRIRGGDNHVQAGTVIEIPSDDDDRGYFTIKLSAGQVSELVTILVSTKPIPGLRIPADRQKLTTQQVESWEKQGKAAVHRLEAKGQAGKALTMAEKQAGSAGNQLTADDPLPQTMYHANCKPDDTVMVQLPLTIVK